MAPPIVEPPSLLDTDTLSAVLTGQGDIGNRAATYLEANNYRFSFSIITRYEIPMGLLARGAMAQAGRFNESCADHEVMPLTDEVIARAAAVYADLRRRGDLIGEADILIAATALVQGRVLVTNSVRHSRRVHGLQVDNWLANPSTS